MLWCDLKATTAAAKKEKSLLRGEKNSTKRANDDLESRDKNHPQKSIVKYLFAFFFFFIILLSCLLNLCNQRGLFKYIFNGISTINFIYCHMLMISPFERYRQCWFSKALNTPHVCLSLTQFLSLITIHSEKTLWHFFSFFISSWIFYFINFFLCGHFQLTLFFFFIFRRWLMMRRWKQQQFCITYSLKWNGWWYSRKNSNWELQLGDRDKKSWIADFYHSLLCFYFSDDGWNWGNEWKKFWSEFCKKYLINFNNFYV